MLPAPAMYHFPLPEYRHISGEKLAIRIRISSGHELTSVLLRTEPDNEEALTPMVLELDDGRWQWWSASVSISTHDIQFMYSFKILSHTQQFWLDAAGVTKRAPLRHRQFRWLTSNVPPDWIPHQVFYQVFPDRFCNGDSALNVKDNERLYHGTQPVKAMNWGDPILDQGDHLAFYGGDLPGIQQSLDYIRELGATALYLNPVFDSPSTHRYDTQDYLNVDPHLGGNSALQKLCHDVHQRGMKIVLDAVFNHTSENHPWFNRWSESDIEGAYQNTAGVNAQRYFFFDIANPDSYHCWKGAHTLPTLDWSNEHVQDYFCNPSEGAIQYWLSEPYHIDGWRLDVIHMLGDGEGARNNAARMQQIRHAVKEAQPNAMVLGEHFFEATRWLQGDQEDAAMNYYGFATPVRAFFASQDIAYQPCQIDAEDFDEWLTDARTQISFEHQLCQFNLLDSHDTARFFTLVNEQFDVMKQAVMMLMTYPGVPSIYYGDEVGMSGQNDPYCRACFDWTELSWNTELLDWYKTCIALRQNTPVLQTGAYATLHAKGDVFIFIRFDAQHATVIAINRGASSTQRQVTLSQWDCTPNRKEKVIGEAQWQDNTIELPAYGCAVWHLIR
ncbi:maltodextrin glucosidase [Echinimonas agarilytica]|uniref:Maltodextrin glucosidase n=1 Tax=Echinimonas agarilytica TaxID=1215918 RepID=A0AA42B6M7_9GAMM|nr:maltodextrin glucosidase [Echinimonas agarilytica]MCM2678671.1 maltodextrin glucosidase [Echinimonas agarilytica]